uniref:Uncharacterized protein n=1 Tax=Peronospora matthiolae TaxID=2874970 RepID=A0AAV1TVQ1_9STRA
MSADLVNPIDVIKDMTLVHEQSETHPHECEENLTPESIKDMVPNRMQNKSPDSLDGITVGNWEVYRPPDHLGDQEAAFTGKENKSARHTNTQVERYSRKMLANTWQSYRRWT